MIKILQIPFALTKERAGILEVKKKLICFNKKQYILEEYSFVYEPCDGNSESMKSKKVLYASVEINEEEYQKIRELGLNSILRDCINNDTVEEK